jgi:C4-dicarboxylate-specific signal transduction histidine kinase
MRARRRFEIEYEHQHDGRREAYMMSVEALERPDGGAVVTRANVTARRQAQMEIEEQRRELSRLARVAVLGQLSGAFAHELNQPLTAILSNAEAARHSLRRQPPDVELLAAILRDIIVDNKRAASVIDRLRALLKRGDQRLQLIDTPRLIGEVVTLARTELITRQVAVTVHVDPGLPSLWGDKVQLQQVFLNLVLNGCEAMSGMPAPSRQLILTGDVDREGSVHVTVRDYGTGIRPDMVERLFEPFVTTKSDGLGLGLSISRTIVATHGGRLWGANKPMAEPPCTSCCLSRNRQTRRATRPCQRSSHRPISERAAAAQSDHLGRDRGRRYLGPRQRAASVSRARSPGDGLRVRPGVPGVARRRDAAP